MNTKVLEILEFPKIKAAIAAFTVTEQGRSKVERLIPQKNRQIVEASIAQTTDAVNVLRLFGGFPIAEVADIMPIMARLRKHAIISGMELSQILLIFRISDNLRQFNETLDERAIELLFFKEKLAEVEIDEELYARLKRSVDEDGNILDRASGELMQIRKRIVSLQNEQKKRLDHIVHGPEAKYLSESLVTVRNGRQVIPVKAEHKAHFGGIVHDQSATGQTLFIEPQVVLNLNNELQLVIHQEKEEIQKILSEISTELLENIEAITDNARLIYDLDFAEAKAKYAKEINATLPLISTKQEIKLKLAFHPLIDLQKVVKNDFRLGGIHRQMVITGPNTGGKTITLKTVGLTQIMGQAGLYIPAAEESQIAIFSDILADIGDEQSIEQNLSTFSSHMKNIVNILQSSDQDSLLLFDEIGAGTDPEEGASIAISILNHLKTQGCCVLATTHYPELKLYAYNTPEVENASMEFSLESLSPTYHLLIGVPGHSNAFAISRRLGLSEDIVKNAEQLMDNDTVGINEMLDHLENDRKELAANNEAVKEEKERLAELKAQLALKNEELANNREHLIQQAKKEAESIVAQTERESQQIIESLRNQKNGEPVKDNVIIEAKTQLKSLHQKNLTKNRVLKKAHAAKTLQPGDTVYLTSYEQRGVLLQKMGSNAWQVQVGSIKMTVSSDQLEKVQAAKSSPPVIKTKVKANVKRTNEMPSGRLDLRGKRYEEAVCELDHFIDASLLANYPSAIIIHGFGTGTIRNLVQDTLRNNPRVTDFYFAPANEGGNGATIVNFQ
ncbi:endonuclease MutS2 [Xylocopilactobacillus apicola]|uniref:Endonuclease MutS2 n=1 Tax=Xylocopilactobacillus apicola TaxID=2932184 RepID=A0AAU9DTR0_9LACO|nr:endonuclease MutS2 [Xylocopilactobacillus apicola]BDR58808.1 endonuclease MutS2 [Xylocopilactobacillus apicola]